MSDRDKDAEILALRHQLIVLQRQLGPRRVSLHASDRALLAALLHRLPRSVLTHLHLVVKPDTVLRWHRDLVAHRHAKRSRPKRTGRPRTGRATPTAARPGPAAPATRPPPGAWPHDRRPGPAHSETRATRFVDAAPALRVARQRAKHRVRASRPCCGRPRRPSRAVHGALPGPAGRAHPAAVHRRTSGGAAGGARLLAAPRRRRGRHRQHVPRQAPALLSRRSARDHRHRRTRLPARAHGPRTRCVIYSPRPGLDPSRCQSVDVHRPSPAGSSAHFVPRPNHHRERNRPWPGSNQRAPDFAYATATRTEPSTPKADSPAAPPPANAPTRATPRSPNPPASTLTQETATSSYGRSRHSRNPRRTLHQRHSTP